MAFPTVVRMIFLAAGTIGFVVSYLRVRSTVKFVQAKDYGKAKKEALLANVGMFSSWFLFGVAIFG